MNLDVNRSTCKNENKILLSFLQFAILTQESSLKLETKKQITANYLNKECEFSRAVNRFLLKKNIFRNETK